MKYFAQICFKHDHDSLLLAVISNGFLFHYLSHFQVKILKLYVGLDQSNCIEISCHDYCHLESFC